MSGCLSIAVHSLLRRPLLTLMVCAISSAPAKSQTCTVTPKQVKLGETLRILCRADYTKARLNNREAELFIQPDGTRFGLLPISVHDKSGTFDLDIFAVTDLLPQTLQVTIRKTVFP